MNKNPSVYNFSKGISKICLSFKVSYAIATPRVGFAEDNYHGGSQVITSNSLPPNFFCEAANLSNCKSVMLSLIGMVQNY